MLVNTRLKRHKVLGGEEAGRKLHSPEIIRINELANAFVRFVFDRRR